MAASDEYRHKVTVLGLIIVARPNMAIGGITPAMKLKTAA